MSKELSIFSKFSAATLGAKVDQYFETKKGKNRPTLTGLALHLGCTRTNIVHYSKTDEYAPILERAKLKCEHHLEDKLTAGAPVGGIALILKNNYGWKEKVEVDNTHRGIVSLTGLFDAAAKRRLEIGEAVEGEVVEEDTGERDDYAEELNYDNDDELFEIVDSHEGDLEDELF